jgi:hypothetical protein
MEPAQLLHNVERTLALRQRAAQQVQQEQELMEHAIQVGRLVCIDAFYSLDTMPSR